MRRRRRKQNPALFLRQAVLLVVIALIVPVSINLARQFGEALERTGERAAVIAAVAGMPEEGLELLRERYADQLYTPEDEAHLPAGEQSRQEAQPAQQIEQDTTSESGPDGDRPPEIGTTPLAQPNIPEEYRALLLSENFAAIGSNLVQFGAGYIRNETGVDNDGVLDILDTTFSMRFADTAEPQVLIVHTHATEAFERYDSAYYDTRNTWRSRDNNLNMVSVGAAMAQVLEENGIGVIHDTTQHDYPSYNGSYERSAQTIQGYLDEYPSIKVVLDLHRDAMERENQTIVKPVTVIDGQKAAQIMIIAACDDTGDLGVPQYRENLRFAATFQSYMASSYHDLTRPVYFCYRKYNMDLTTGSLLLEFGSNANTLEEAVYAARMAGQALADLIQDYTEE